MIRIALTLVLLLLPLPAASAQDDPVPAAAAEVASPRATVTTLFARDRAGEAAPVFDLSDVAAYRRSYDADRLTRRLVDALDRCERLPVEAEFPAADSPAIEGTSRWAYPVAHPDPMSDAALLLVFERQAGGAWLIGAETIAALPEFWEEVRGLPTLEELAGKRATTTELLRDLRAHVPAGLQEVGFLFEHWQWIGLFALVLAAVVLDRVVRLLAGLATRRALARWRVEAAHDVDLFARPIGIFCGALLLKGLLRPLDLGAGVAGILSLAAATVMAATGVWAAYRLVDVVCAVFAERADRSRSKFDDVFVPLLRRTLKILVVIAGIAYIAGQLTEELWGIVAGVSVGSIALTFAARDSVENLFGTFTVLLDKPFQLGDWITVGDVDGTVEEVGFRSTRVRTFYNSVITVPNRTFISSNVDNWGARRYRRIRSTLGLAYGTPPEKIEAFCEGVREILRKHPFTRKDYYHVYLDAFGPHSLDVLLYCFVETPDWATELREKHRLFNDVLRLAEALGVEFALPTQRLHLVRGEAAAPSDRPGTIDDGLRRGRAAAESVAAESLGGLPEERPPTPRFDGPDPDHRLGGDE